MPAAVGAAILGQLIALLPSLPAPWLPAFVNQLLASYLMPLLFVTLGAAVAPTRKFEASILLAVMSVFLHGLTAGLAVAYGYFAGPLWVFSAAIILAVGASGHGVWIVFKEQEETTAPLSP